MLSVSEAEGRAGALVEAALKAGADAADALYIGDASTEVQVRLGALEDVARSEGEEIGLRFFAGSRSASVSSSDLSAEALAALVERAAAMAREAPEDPYAGLAPEDRLLRGAAPDLEADDGADPAPVALGRARAGDRGCGPRRSRRHQQRRRGRQRRADRRRAGDQPRLRARLFDQRLWRLGQRDRRDGQRHAARLCASIRPAIADLDGPEAIGRRRRARRGAARSGASCRAARCRWCSIRASARA